MHIYILLSLLPYLYLHFDFKSYIHLLTSLLNTQLHTHIAINLLHFYSTINVLKVRAFPIWSLKLQNRTNVVKAKQKQFIKRCLAFQVHDEKRQSRQPFLGHGSPEIVIFLFQLCKWSLCNSNNIDLVEKKSSKTWKWKWWLSWLANTLHSVVSNVFNGGIW